MQKAERSLLTRAVALVLVPAFRFDENMIYSPRLNHADPIYWLAHGGGGEGVITSKYHTGTAAGLLIGSARVTWFQLHWRSDFDSVCCQECLFLFFLLFIFYFQSRLISLCVVGLMIRPFDGSHFLET